jgi:DinB superfamily/Pentapeptide repeats (8 copies)
MPEEFSERDLAGARFARVDLSGATFERVDLTGARFSEAELTGVRMRGVLLRDVDISGDVEGLVINSIDVGPLIEAELDRRHPERAKLRPTDAAGYREAWAVIEGLWAGTVSRARGLDPALLHERVAGEWSFIETLRHLVFATDAWVRRVMLGDPSPWDPLDLPWDEMPDMEGIPRDRDARPTLAHVLTLREDRMATVRGVVGELTDEQLAGSTTPVTEPGWPRPNSYAVRDVLGIVINEEWWHRQFAERDMDALTARSSAATRS